MPATHHRDFIHQLRVLLVFNGCNILMCILMEIQGRTHLNPAPSPALQPPAQPQPEPVPRRRRKPPNPWVMPSSKNKKRDATATSYTQTSQETRILSGCPLPFLPHQGTQTPPHQEVSHQFQEATVSWMETSHNPETSGHWIDLNLPAVSLVCWLHHHLSIRPTGLLSHPCGIPGQIFALP